MNSYQYGRSNTAQSTEIDYGDIPDTLNEDAMRAYLQMESKVVLPNHKKHDSFEQQWNNGRQQYSQQPQESSPSPQPPPSSHKSSSHQPQPNSYQPQYVASPQHHQSTNTRPNDKSIAASNAYSHASHSNHSYDPNVIDRMSTVNMVHSKGNHRREHSFRKQPVKQNVYQFQPQNTSINAPLSTASTTSSPPKSALTAQISPHKNQLANQQDSGVAQSRNPEGKLVVKQLPYSKKTHVMVNVFVEISSEHIEQIIVYFNKHLSVREFLDLLKNETNNGAFKDFAADIFCADEDGDLDEDFPAPEPSAIIANLGLKNFYIKLKGANEEQRNDIRRSTLAHKDRLLSTAEVDKMHRLNEEEDEEDEDEYEDEEQQNGCNCIIL